MRVGSKLKQCLELPICRPQIRGTRFTYFNSQLAK